MIELFPFQEADVANLLAHDATGIVVADTGAGKTVIAAATAVRSQLPTTFIVAPKGTHERVWRRTILELDPNARVSVINSTEVGQQAMDDLEWQRPGFYLTTPQLFTRWDFGKYVRPDLTIVDEVHKLTNRTTAGGRKLMKFKTGHRVPMSGTLVRNHFENIWTTLRFAYPELNGSGEIADMSSVRWVTNFCETVYDHFAIGNRKVVGELVPGRVAGLVPCWIQHFKRAKCCEYHPEGFLHDLPEPLLMKRYVELVPGQKRAIKQMEEEYVAWLKNEAEENKVIHVKLPLEKQLRLSQMTLGVPSVREVVRMKLDKETNIKSPKLVRELYFEADCESPKMDELWEIMDANLGEPVVASTRFQTFAQETVRRANARGIRAFEWSAQHTQSERDQALDDLREGRLDLIVGVTSAIAEGIDGLQDASGILVECEIDPDMTIRTQLLGRQDRRGQIRTDGVLHYQIIAEGSADEGMAGEHLRRQLQINKSLRREVRRQVA